MATDLFGMICLFNPRLNASWFVVLLCNIKQQVLQRHRACPRSDHGEYVALYLSLNGAQPTVQTTDKPACSHSTRGCISYPPCCWCVWACRWSTAPSWRRFWESCSSTSTTDGSTSSSWSAPCPASSSFISPTSRHQRNTWPSDPVHLFWPFTWLLLTPGGLWIWNIGLSRNHTFLYMYMRHNYLDCLFLNQEWLIVGCKWWGNYWKVDFTIRNLPANATTSHAQICVILAKIIFSFLLSAHTGAVLFTAHPCFTATEV